MIIQVLPLSPSLSYDSASDEGVRRWSKRPAILQLAAYRMLSHQALSVKINHYAGGSDIGVIGSQRSRGNLCAFSCLLLLLPVSC